MNNKILLGLLGIAALSLTACGGAESTKPGVEDKSVGADAAGTGTGTGVSGKTLGAFLQEEISGPLGIDFHVGLGPEYDPRVAEMIPFQLPATENAGIIADLLRDTDSMVFKARKMRHLAAFPDETRNTY